MLADKQSRSVTFAELASDTAAVFSATVFLTDFPFESIPYVGFAAAADFFAAERFK